jgi:hypothetical protein
MSKQTLQDYELLFSNAQAFTVATTVGAAGAASTNQIDLGAAGMGEGVAVKGVINVTALTGTLTVTIGSKATTGPVYTDAPVTLTTISSTGQVHFTLPQSCLRYVKLFYATTTSATVTAWLTAETRNY